MRYMSYGLLVVAVVAFVAATMLRSTTLLIAAGVAVAVAVASWWHSRGQLGVFLLASCVVTGLVACTQVTARPPIDHLMPCHPALKAQLIDSDRSLLPQEVAGMVSNSSDIMLRYSEEVTHEHYTVPVGLIFLLSVPDLFGAPLGNYTANAKAALFITKADVELAVYRGEARASRWYGLYYGSTYRELEREARRAVRQVIDEALCRDADRLGRIVETANK